MTKTQRYDLRRAVKENAKSNVDLRKKVMNKSEWKNELIEKMKLAIRKMQRFGINLEDVMGSNIVANRPFYSENSYSFIQAVKRDKANLVIGMLDNGRRLIFEYDTVKKYFYNCLGLAKCLPYCSKKRL